MTKILILLPPQPKTIVASIWGPVDTIQGFRFAKQGSRPTKLHLEFQKFIIFNV